MGSPINTGLFAKDLKPIVKRWIGQGYEMFDPQYKQVFVTDPSNDAYEEYESFAGLGMAQVKEQGASIAYDTMQQLFNTRITSVTMGLGFQITREMIEDGKVLRIAERRAKELGKAHIVAKETIAANILNRAFNSSYAIGDAKALCATDHPTLGADLANKIAVDADISEVSLEQAVIDIRNYTDNRGLKMMVTPERLIIPVALQFDVVRILKGTERPGTADRDVNALNRMNLLQQDPVVWNYLTDSDAWFIKTSENVTGNGLIYVERRAFEMDDDNDFDTHNAKFQASERYQFGAGDPRCIYGSAGA